MNYSGNRLPIAFAVVPGEYPFAGSEGKLPGHETVDQDFSP